MADMQRIKRELKYAGAVVDVYADTMKFKNGNTEVWDTVLHKKGAAAVIPVLPDGREIPAGCKDSPDEESIVCAARELEEETGYHSDCLEKLFTISTTVAVFGETFDVFVATSLVHTKSNPDPNEFINVEIHDIDELAGMIYSGRIQDGKTIAAILAYKDKYIKA